MSVSLLSSDDYGHDASEVAACQVPSTAYDPSFFPAVSDADQRRAIELRNYEILDSPAEAAFDRITRLAKHITGTSIALISLMEKDRQWFKSHDGLDVCETSRDVAFCNRTIEQNSALVVTDALADPGFSSNPLVTGFPFIRFYAGVPLRTPRGVVIGSLCVIDPELMSLTPAQMAALEDLARIVVDEMELRRLATDDSLTGALTKQAFNLAAHREMSRALRSGDPLSVAVFDIDHFKAVNDTYGHAAGDVVLTEIIAMARSVLRSFDIVGRIGGEEFAVLMPQADISSATQSILRLRRKIAQTEIQAAACSIAVTASFGLTTIHVGDDHFSAALQRADAALYLAKGDGRNRVIVHELEPRFAEASVRAS